MAVDGDSSNHHEVGRTVKGGNLVENKALVQLSDGRKIVAEVLNYDGKHPELCIYSTGANGQVDQDICVVRPAFNGQAGAVSDTSYDCLVWTEADNEDYTHRYVINRFLCESYEEGKVSDKCEEEN